MPLTEEALNELSEAYWFQARYHEAEGQLVSHLTNIVRALQYFPDHELVSRVRGRIKDFQDIVDKVDRGRRRRVRSLRQLEHNVVTDIVGTRIITDYLFQVRQIAREISNSSHWTIQKNNRGRVDRHFGYRSLHLDVTLNRTTYHQNIRCEIQVRTLLQHAFASWVHPVYERYREDPRSIPSFLRGRLRQVSDSLNDIDRNADRLYKDISKVL